MAYGTITTLEAQKANRYLGTDENMTGKVYDMYAPLLNYKQEIDVSNRPGISINWVPSIHQRRVKAYELLWSYWNNISRDYRKAPETGDDSLNDNLQECGDAEWLSGKVRSKLLGERVSISSNVEQLTAHIDTLTKLLENSEVSLESNQKTAFIEKLTSMKRKKYLSSAQEAYLKDWWHDQGIYNIIEKAETKCGYLGDCVYKLTWDDRKKVVKVEEVDPGFAFPYYYDGDMEMSWDVESGDKVVQRFILAWETDIQTDTTFYIYREVYELRENKAGEQRCFVQKAYFEFVSEAVDVTSLTDKELAEGSTLDWIDLEVDFVPLVWIANLAVAGEEPFGLSNLHFSIDQLDSMITAGYDLSTNCDYLGGVTLIASGKNMKFRRDADTSEPIAIPIAPKRMYYVGEDGKITLLDTSQMQTALLATIEAQEQRFLRNNNIPLAIAGKLKGGDIPSGVALSIMLQPLVDKITPMRQQRYESYAYLFYYVMKLYQQFGGDYEQVLFSGDLPEISLSFGPMLPSDATAAIERYVKMQSLLDDETILEIAKQEGMINVDLDQVKKRLEEQRQKRIEEQQAAFSLQRTSEEQGQE